MMKAYVTCPRCGRYYEESHSALSRKDNTSLVCAECGTREALEEIGVTGEKQDEVMELIQELYKIYIERR